jgi:DNA-binding transcriptional LysR family regulator
MANVAAIVAFAEAARRSSFAAAARELGLTPSAVAKSVARLEADLGVRLFHRTTRKVALTGDGRSLFARCERIVGELEALRDEAAGARAQPSGTLRINVPIAFGKLRVVPVLAALVREHPGLALEVSFTDRFADLAAEGLDAAVRAGALHDSGLVARPIGGQAMIVCGAPGYLARAGTPRRPADLAKHACLAFRIPSSGRLWTWRFQVDGRAFEWEPRSGIAMDDGEALVAAAEAGMGLAHVPDYMAAEAISRGRLVEVLRRFRPPEIPLSVVYLSARRVPPRLRAFVEAVSARPSRPSGSPRRRS